MADDPVIAFIVTIFSVKHCSQSLHDHAEIELSHRNHAYKCGVSPGGSELPQSYSFYTHAKHDHTIIDTNSTLDQVRIAMNGYQCVLRIPAQLYFEDKIMHEVVMKASGERMTTASEDDPLDMAQFLPPVITVSVTSILPLPFILTPSSSTHNMPPYLNNNVPSPVYLLNIDASSSAHATTTTTHAIYALVSKFIDHSDEIVTRLNDNSHNSSDDTWDEIKRNIKVESHRHSTLMAVFLKLHDIQQHRLKCVVPLSTYKLLYRLLHKVLNYANPSPASSTLSTSTTIDVVSFYLVLCIGRICYYRHQQHINCLIDDLDTKWMDVDGIYALIHYLMRETGNQCRSHGHDVTHYRLAYLRMIASFILTHQTENGHMRHKLDKMYHKLSLLHAIVDKLPERLLQSMPSNDNSSSLDVNREMDVYALRQYLFAWLIQPICDWLLATTDTQNNRVAIRRILAAYRGHGHNDSSESSGHNNSLSSCGKRIFGYLYGDAMLDAHYHSLVCRYFQDCSKLRSISLSPPQLATSVPTSPAPVPNDMTEAKQAAQTDAVLPPPMVTNTAATGTHAHVQEPMLKHYISNYAVPRQSSIDANTLNHKLNEEDDFWVMAGSGSGAMMSRSNTSQSVHAMPSQSVELEESEFPVFESGEQENAHIKKLAFTNQIALKIPGFPLVHGTLKLTNYRLLFIPLQRGFLQFRAFRHYFEIPLGAIYQIVSSAVDAMDVDLILHQQLMSLHSKPKRRRRRHHHHHHPKTAIATSAVPNTNHNHNHNTLQHVRCQSENVDVKQKASPTPSAPSSPRFVYEYQLQVVTKDCRNLKFVFANVTHEAFEQLVRRLRSNSFTNHIEKTFAVQRCASATDTADVDDFDGWNVYDFFAEFARQKVPLQRDHDAWRISSINRTYGFSETYPRYLIVPRRISDADLQSIKVGINNQSPFRSKARIPALTYFHAATKAVIMRSSQPMTGMGGLGGFVSTSWWSQNRCPCDEELLSSARIKVIIDARPRMNAEVNKAAGGGYENTVDVYKHMRLIFGNIHNIHEVRKAFDQLVKTVQQCINSHNQSLHVPHIKYLYIGHKASSSAANEHESHDAFDDVQDDFGVISTNEIADGDAKPPALAAHSRPLHKVHPKTSASAGELSHLNKIGKFGKSLTMHLKSSVVKQAMATRPSSLKHKHEHSHRNTANNGSRSVQSSPPHSNKPSATPAAGDTPGPGSIAENVEDQNGDLYHSVLRDDNFWSAIVASSWFQYLRSIIVCSICIVSMVDTEKKSVLIHCTDGWDRTSQLCALSQVMLDPYFRTIEGLAVLIEKDWVSFGHKFSERFGHTRSDVTNDQRCPVFIQFLDCVYQIAQQFPNQFEYNSQCLSWIAYHATSCLYGTFLADSERLRRETHQLHSKSKSLWSRLLDEQFAAKHQLKNVHYQKCDSVLYMDHRSINLKLWDFYTKMDPFPTYQTAAALNSAQQCNPSLLQPQSLHKIQKTDIMLKRKDLEIEQLKQEIKKLKSQAQLLSKDKSRYDHIMRFMQNNNGFLLQNQVPIIPDLDYVSAHTHNQGEEEDEDDDLVQ